MESDGNEDLGWLAFRYISNEMTQPEFESFEQRLSQDQLAREAVAQAVSWTRAVASGERQVLPARRAVFGRRVRWFAAAAASIAAAAIVIHSARDALELKTLARALAEHMSPGTFSVADTGLLADTDDATSIDDETDLTIPSWMIEAVVGSSDSDKWEDI